MKSLKVTPRKDFVLFIILGSLLTLAGILFFPLWAEVDVFWADWGRKIIQLIIAAFLLLYLFGYLLKKVTKGGNGVVKVLTIVEFVLLLLIALGCVLSQFKVINISGACVIFGLCLWCRGVIEIFRAYYYQKGNATKYPLWWLCVAIAMVSLGIYCIAKPLFSDIVILWIFDILLFVLGIFMIVYGSLCAPKSNKKPKKNKSQKTSE